MILRNLTIILFIISIICIVLGKVIKKNKVCMLGYGIIVVIIIFWIVFFIYALSENDKELENQNIVYGNENFKSEITNNRNEIDDLTFKMQNETYYKYGQVYKVNDKKIYFIDKEENKNRVNEKKYKSKGFAAGCSREVIERGAEQLGWDLEKLLTMTLQAMAATEDTIQAEMTAEQ